MATSVFPAVTGLQKQRPGVLYPHAHWWFLACLVLTWVGFSRTYFAVLGSEPLLHHVHGALMGGWMLTLIVQPVLYQQNRIKLHRSLGRWAVYLLVPAIVVCGFLMVRNMLRNTHIPPFIVNHLAFLDVTSLLEFPAFISLAVVYGRNVALHARFIVCTVLLTMPPALARATQLAAILRWPFALHVNVAMGVMCVALLLLIADDRRKGRVYPVYPVALVVVAAVSVAANFANGWAWWHALAAVIRGA